MGDNSHPVQWLSTDIQECIADCDGLACGINFDYANHSVAGGRSDLGRRGGELSPVGSSDGATVSNCGQTSSSSSGHVVPLGCFLSTVDDDGGLTGVGSSGDDVQGLQDLLTAVVVDCIGLLVENEAVVNETTFNYNMLS